MNYLANILTGLSLASGFISIWFSLQYHFTSAAWAIIFSVVFDGLDGPVARINPVPSEFGKELDSLVDVVSFGVAPAILGYFFISRNQYILASAALFSYLLFSVLRLAKYNITPHEKLINYFYGLPTTIAGGIFASFILIYRQYDYLPRGQFYLAVIFLLAFLMVSKVKYLNLKGLKQVLGSGVSLVLIVFGIVGLFFDATITVFIYFNAYLILSPFLVNRLPGNNQH